MNTGEITKVRVEMTVTEEVTYDFPVTVEVPTVLADDPEALTEYLVENEDLWLDDLPITGGSEVCLAVNEPVVEEGNLLPFAEAG
ncbi:hypothetical protein [Streptomyces sp. NPDC001401]|uniref:hypothetical protein n=1 Tax=Streptomyces sp. NPDC001401 TaxID=3364570 RepID=UPI00369874B4